jgi:hypothetical protein
MLISRLNEPGVIDRRLLNNNMPKSDLMVTGTLMIAGSTRIPGVRISHAIKKLACINL